MFTCLFSLLLLSRSRVRGCTSARVKTDVWRRTRRIRRAAAVGNALMLPSKPFVNITPVGNRGHIISCDRMFVMLTRSKSQRAGSTEQTKKNNKKRRKKQWLCQSPEVGTVTECSDDSSVCCKKNSEGTDWVNLLSLSALFYRHTEK